MEAQLDGKYESGSGLQAAFAKLFGQAPKVLRAAQAAARLAAARIETPLGPMVAVASARGICLLDFMDRKRLPQAVSRLRHSSQVHILPADNEHLRQLARELGEYFAATRKRFDTPIDLRVGTSFQRRSWEFLRTIAFGETRSYGEQARALGQPGAVRAVGSANATNYVAILIPCHRVIGATGALTGYGGGVARKRWLLEHEASHRG